MFFCGPVTRDGRCPDCGWEGRYGDSVIRPLTDLPVAGYPLVVRVTVPRYRCLNTQGGGPTGLDDAAVRPRCVAAAGYELASWLTR
jgi:zinc-finger of transposase IS204/IS1001/IS1096/IS1165